MAGQRARCASGKTKVTEPGTSPSCSKVFSFAMLFASCSARLALVITVGLPRYLSISLAGRADTPTHTIVSGVLTVRLVPATIFISWYIPNMPVC